MARNHALVAGATGAAATRLVERLAREPDWDVVGLCRTPPADSEGVRYLALDLTDAGACAETLGALAGTTHLFYASRAEHGEGAPEDVARNLTMLRNTVESVEAVAKGLKHVHVVTGTNYYGLTLGPYRTPAREDDARHMPPDFYYELEDYVAARQRGKSWTWSVSRPDVICDFRPGRARNAISSISVYAAICKELSLPLSFPGHPGAYEILTEATEATHLADAIVWMATTESCANQAFNVFNGDPFRWRNLWPRIAAFFEIEIGPVRRIPMAEFMADKAPVWERIVAKHGLEPTPFAQIALWPYADWLFDREYDQMSDMTKARLLGYAGFVDTEEMFIRLMARYRGARLIP